MESVYECSRHRGHDGPHMEDELAWEADVSSWRQYAGKPSAKPIICFDPGCA